MTHAFSATGEEKGTGVVGSSQADGARQGHASSAHAEGALAPARSQLTDLHRARILTATARTLDARGYAGTTVAQVIETARVSRSRFYELFGSCDACITALLDELVDLVEQQMTLRGLGRLPWAERVREGLWVILCCLEQQPVLARSCILHSVGAGGPAAERREDVIALLVSAIDAGREAVPENDQVTPMTAEGVVAAATRLVYSRLGSEQDSLTDLLGELSGLILLPYIGAEETRTVVQSPRPAAVIARGDILLGGALEASPEASDPLRGITMRLTQRTALALEAVAQNPGASNRAVADRAGIADQGQASKLLARLERLGLIKNEAVTETKWELNSWTLTASGRRVVRLFAVRSAAAYSELAAVAALVTTDGA